MSLLSFVKHPEHVAKLKVLRPAPPRKIGVPMIEAPRSNRYGLIGTAFDYLLRFEIERVAPHATTKPWATEWHLERPSIQGQAGPTAFLPRLRRLDAIVEAARVAHKHYCDKRKTDRSDREEIARHALRLARLEPLYRGGFLDETNEAADEDLFREPEIVDVAEITALLAIVPIDEFQLDRKLILNPIFGRSSKQIGGADADLVVGDLLIDIKTTKKNSIEGHWLDQLLGYLLLARYERRHGLSFPEIEKLGFYFARHGFLWVRHVSEWVGHQQFAEIEKWFVATALERPPDDPVCPDR